MNIWDRVMAAGVRSDLFIARYSNDALREAMWKHQARGSFRTRDALIHERVERFAAAWLTNPAREGIRTTQK